MKYSPEVTARIVEGIKGLKGRVGSSEAAGINFSTFCEWMKKPNFSHAIKKAELESESKGEERAILSIFKAMENQWQAGAWWLERTKPDKYALKTKNEHVLDVGRMLLVRSSASLGLLKAHIGNTNGNGAKP